MVVVDLLHSLGVSGSIATIIAGVIALKHGRELFGWAATLGIYARVVGMLGFTLLVLSTGLVPGVEVDIAVQLETIADLGSAGFDMVSGLARSLL